MNGFGNPSRKFVGKNGLVSFLASDPEFFAVRRFDKLHTLSLLSLQDELASYEEKLDNMNARFSSQNVMLVGRCPSVIVEVPPGGFTPEEEASNQERYGVNAVPRHINNGTFRDEVAERKELTEKMTSRLMVYGLNKLLLRYYTLHSKTKAPQWTRESIENWFYNNKGAVVEDKQGFIKHKDDLRGLREEKSLMRRFFEHKIIYPTGIGTRLRFFQKEPAEDLGCQETSTYYRYSDEGIDRLALFASLSVTIAMFLAPMWIMHTLDSGQTKLIVITCFSLTWFVFLAVAAIGSALTNLAATAG
ncbi:hypothetical protein VDGL01_03623 [Verticillium dahliae]